MVRFLRCFSQYSFVHRSTVVTVLSESTVVCSRFHTFQLQLCSTVTDKAAAEVFWIKIESMCHKNTPGDPCTDLDILSSHSVSWFLSQKRSTPNQISDAFFEGS